MFEIRRSYCGLCHPRCGTLLHMENDKAVKTMGGPDYAISQGEERHHSKALIPRA